MCRGIVHSAASARRANGTRAPRKWHAPAAQMARARRANGPRPPRKWLAPAAQMARARRANDTRPPRKCHALAAQMARARRANGTHAIFARRGHFWRQHELAAPGANRSQAIAIRPTPWTLYPKGFRDWRLGWRYRAERPSEHSRSRAPRQNRSQSCHRSHFGSRYKSGCCNFAGLLRRLLWAPGLLAQAAACLTNRTTACPGARSARTTACPDNNRAPRSAVAWRGHFLAVAVRGEIPRGCYCASQGEVLPRRHGRLANNFLPQPR